MNDSGRKPRLLLVEGNREDTFLIKKMLRDTGIELDVTVAEDGEKAMDILDRANGDHKRPIVFVILGIDLPKIDGFEVLSYMKKMHGMKDLPVVVLTRSINNAERDRVLLMGATHYLVKPSSYREFSSHGRMDEGSARESLGFAVRKCCLARDQMGADLAAASSFVIARLCCSISGVPNRHSCRRLSSTANCFDSAMYFSMSPSPSSMNRTLE